MKYDKSYFVKLLIFICLMFIVLLAMYNLASKIEVQKCSMTYMWELPIYKQHFPPVNESDRNRYYGLYHYTEGNHYLRMKGVPVLFVPGNSGSYKQVRSLASVSLRMSLKHGDAEQLLDYFTVDLNEELSALSADIIRRQVQYVDACLSYIESLYGHDGRAIVLVGHSMGAVVARAVVAMSPHRVVPLIVALASPFEIPMVGVDPGLVPLYQEINKAWAEAAHTKDTVIVSVTGGSRDLLVWDGYGRVITAQYSLWLPANSVWSSTDHLSIVWCRELVLALTKAMHYSVVTKPTRPHIIIATFNRYLLHASPAAPTHTHNIEYYYRLLVLPITLTLASSAHTHTNTIALPALASVTRPLRLKVSTHSCAGVSSTKVTLISGYHRHRYAHIVQWNESVLLTVSDIHTHNISAATVQVQVPGGCEVVVRIDVSLVDWVAQLARIHMGRVPALISALTITQYTHSTHTILTLPVVLATVRLATWLQWSSDLTWLHQYTMIDLVDLTALLLLALPITLLLTTAISTLAHILRLLLPLPKSVAIATLAPIAAILAIVTPRPFSCLAYLPLLLIHIVASNTHKQATHKHNRDMLTDKVLTLLLTLVFLLHLPPLVAEIHSLLQQHSVVDIVAMSVAGLRAMGGVGVPHTHVLVTVVVLVCRMVHNASPPSPGSAGTTPPWMTAASWLTSSGLASCCLLYGAVDCGRCASYLVASMLLLCSRALLTTI